MLQFNNYAEQIISSNKYNKKILLYLLNISLLVEKVYNKNILNNFF